MAPNGDTATFTGSGTFGVHPKSASGAGTITHTFAAGGSVTLDYTVTEMPQLPAIRLRRWTDSASA